MNFDASGPLMVYFHKLSDKECILERPNSSVNRQTVHAHVRDH